MADALVYTGMLLLPVLLAVLLWWFARQFAREQPAEAQPARSERRRENPGRRRGQKGRVAAAPPPAAPAKAATRWPVLIGVNLLVFLLGSSIVLLGFETYYRFIYDTTDSFALTRTTMEWFDRHSRANKFGVRDDVEYELKRTPGKPRVTFLGDSFSAGHGVAKVGDRFENLIRRERPQWEVHALARSGYDTGAEVRFLQENVRKGYELDRVVLMYCLNDISDIVPEWGKIIDRIRPRVRNPGFIVDHSYLANVLYYRLQAARDPDVSNYYAFVRNAYDGKVWENQQGRLSRLDDFVKANGGKLMVATFPFLHAVGPHYDYQHIHDRLDAFWKSRGVPHLDLLAAYSGRPSKSLTVNSWDAHPNELANRLAANALEEFLDREVGNTGGKQ